MSKNKRNTDADNTLSVRNFPAALCRTHESLYGEEPFLTLSFRFKDRWGSFYIDHEDIEPSFRRDGEEIPNRLNIRLGSPDDVRMVSLMSDDGEYYKQAMFNRTILNSIMDSRRDYLKTIAI